MSTIFSKIINHDIPGYFVYEDDVCVAIMDAFPAVPGQTLVVPKREVDYILDLTDQEYTHLFTIAKKVARASDEVMGAKRTCFVVEGFEVPHVHIRLYPMTKTDRGLGKVMVEQNEAPKEELEELAEKIRQAIVEQAM